MNFNRIDTLKLYPLFFALLKQLVVNCEKRGMSYHAICGLRSGEEQASLYAQGRSTPGKIVTNAKPWLSYHNFGLAVDFSLDMDQVKAGLQPSWNIADYEILAEEARKLGLITGMDFKTFKEGPHIQFKTTKTLAQLKALYDAGGLENVFKNL